MTNTNETTDPVFHGRYILNDEGNPVPEPDLMKWAQWIESYPDRQIGRITINGIFVSTVFLGLDHAFLEDKPILWETMQFNGKQDEWMERYSTREEAIKGHNDTCESVRKRFNKKHVHPLDQRARSVGDKELRRRKYVALNIKMRILNEKVINR